MVPPYLQGVQQAVVLAGIVMAITIQQAPVAAIAAQTPAYKLPARHAINAAAK